MLETISTRTAGSPRRPSTGRLAALLAVSALAWLAPACGDGAGSDPGSTDKTTDVAAQEDLGNAIGDTAAEDAGATAEDSSQSGTDSGASDKDSAATAPDVGPTCPGEPGCTCLSAQDCDSNFCIDTPEGKICTTTCVDACPSNFKCTTVPGPGGDSQNICVPSWGKRCNPCNENADCKAPGHGDAVCLDLGATGRFCGAACVTSTDCGEGFKCEEATDVTGQKSKQCVVAGAGVCPCSKAAIASELSTSCWVSAGEAKCSGKRTCLAAGKDGAPPGGGLSACIAPKPEPEVCDGVDNDCDGQSDEETCDDQNPCTSDACGGPAGCQHQNKQGSCNADNSACTEGDACTDGKCVPGKQLDCNDGNLCTTDLCKPDTGCAFEPKNNAPCNADDSPCTVADACDEGVCKQGPPKQCGTEDFCVIGKCDLVTGKCKFAYKDGTPCNDGNACTSNDVCVEDICKGSNIVCNDDNVCTSESCDPAKSCAYTVIGGPCDDGDACTKDDGCEAGKCVGLALEVSAACDDTNPCTTDSCDAKTGCVHAPSSGAACEDGNPCTTSDLCKLGKCEPGSNLCTCKVDLDCKGKEDGNLCNGTLYCDKGQLPWSCKVNPATVIKCDASLDDACKTNVCDPLKGTCGAVLEQEGTPCDADGSLCTVGDACKGGTCAPGSLASCDDANPCTDDVCDPKKGCVTTPNASPCDADGDLCTVGDGCQSGKCVVGSVKTDCNDNEPCTSESCVKSTGKCSVQQLSQGCDDGSACTVGEACGKHPQTGAWTCVATLLKQCDDANQCTDDACDPKQGCLHLANTKPCDADGDACTVGDACSEGKCVVGTGTKDCDDKEPCTEDSCDKASGNCGHKDLQKSCDDGSSCTVGDACGKDAKTGAWTCVPGQGPDCDDSNVCTVDTCDAVKGCTHTVDTQTGHPCYTGDPKTKGVGVCKPGQQTCDGAGKLGDCKGEVLPGPKELCTGLDDNCNGATDEGCKPLGFEASFGAAAVNAKGSKHQVTALVGEASVGGSLQGTKTSARLGFAAWLRSLMGGK